METTSTSTANEQQGGKKRIVWLDDAKMFAMLCVIFYHCLKYMPADMAGCSDTIEVITSFNMHLFVVLAGFTSFRALQRIACWDDYRRYVVKIVLHLLVPTFAIGLLRALLTLDPHAIGNEQWFLKFLFRCLLMFATSCWLVAIASRRLDKTDSTRINQEYVEIAKYIGFLLLMFCTSKTKLPEFASYFLFGYLVKKYDLTGMLFRMKSNPRQFNIMLTAISLAGILTVACTFGISHSFDFYDYPLGRLSNDGMLSVFFARQICGFGWVLFFMPLFFLLSRRYTLFSYWGSKSLGLYIIHTFLLHIFIEQLPFRFYSGYIGWIEVFTLTMALTMMSMIIIRLLEQNKYTSFLFLGNAIK